MLQPLTHVFGQHYFPLILGSLTNSHSSSWSAYNLLNACLACQGHEKAVSEFVKYTSLLQFLADFFWVKLGPVSNRVLPVKAD